MFFADSLLKHLALGGPDGELGASLRYLSQRYAMKDNVVKGILTDIGTEELGHLEMVGTIVHQLARNATTGEIEKSPMAPYFIDNGRGVYPASAAGVPFSASSIASKSDIIANLVEDLAAEQKARAVYDNILRVCDDPDVAKVIKFLRQREITHFQRFGEAKRKLTSRKKAHSLRCFAAPIKYKSYDIEL